ncbi:20394_t:CDS:2 [Cetraspora pellucida]|uniref:20394_t:CDS:1 n=1 Tax=Cetraspora pellucida TaxID=1433469 RepID=A0A9N8ZZT0_9GLOM|nr:20394_t:CDS:2 [Cetraspora pellucida]
MTFTYPKSVEKQVILAYMRGLCWILVMDKCVVRLAETINTLSILFPNSKYP